MSGTYRTAMIELTLVCRRCQGEQPLGALAEPVACAQCGEANPIPWRGMFVVDMRSYDVELLDGLHSLSEGTVMARRGEALAIRVEVGPVRCRCGAPLPVEAIQRANRLRPHVTCGACAARTAARRPPDPMLAAYPMVMYVVGEGAAPAADARSGVVIKCGECGARIDADVCPHCGSKNARPAGVGRVTAGHALGFVFRTER